MRLPGWISLKLILSQVLAVFQIGINYFDGKFVSSCAVLVFICIFFAFLFCFLLSCFSLSPGGPLWRVLPQRPIPVAGEGWLSCGERAPDFLVLPPQRSLRFRGPLALATSFARGKTALPRAGNPPRVVQVVPFQVDRKHRQEFRAVLFPFSREDWHRFSLRMQAILPYRRKTPRPMGWQLAMQDSVPLGMSHGRAEAWKTQVSNPTL